MNEELNNALTAFIESITMAAQKAGEFGAEQLPDVVEQLLAWEFLRSVLWCIPSMLTVGAIIFFHRCMWKNGGWARDTDGDIDGDAIVPSIWLTVVGSIAAWIMFSLDWLQILIAPKVYLIEYAADLIK